MTVTKAQRKALKRVYDRERGETPATFQGYLRFRRKAFRAFGNCLMVPFAGMILGIESDGYTHS